ncbi:hypothetical protein D1631_11900 [Chryseobacterium nematophagum]|uniref:Thiol-activated cytolysin n=1 Tax=Chryseobacterium nematophagum TaxID=2305228 RepID=A0A3M7TI65_9FLAO|nr:thiol-activated cytolysin family protein [Chryseobacterium nematophagum]RNA62587.1 hypothetical protein D1631_11900 [Chryseobacterium nematophagum]
MKLKFSMACLLIMTLSSCNQEELSMESKNNISVMDGIYDGPPTSLKTSIIQTSDNPSPHSKSNKNCITKNFNYNKVFDDFTAFNTRSNILWPGNLIQESTFLSGNLAVLPTGNNGKNPITVKVDAPALGINNGGKTIENPNAANVQQALGELLQNYLTSGTRFPANYEISIQRAYSSKQLQTALNIGYTGLAGNIEGKFGFSFNRSKTYYAVTLKQVFFTFSVDANKTSLQGTEGWVKPHVNIRQSPVVIETVTYGRLYTLIYESEASATELSAALEALYRTPAGFVSGDFNSKYKDIMDNTRVYAKQIGGSATAGMEAALDAMAKDFTKVKTFMKNGAEFSKENMGAIIQYTALNTSPQLFNQPVTKQEKGTAEFIECIDNSYKFILKNNYTITLPLRIKNRNENFTENYYLAPGESIAFPFDANRMQFTYSGKLLEQIDLNNGSPSDDIDFKEKDEYNQYPNIQYITKRIGIGNKRKLFDNYKAINTTVTETIFDEDGINHGPSAVLMAKKEPNHNSLVVEIKEKQRSNPFK